MEIFQTFNLGILGYDNVGKTNIYNEKNKNKFNGF